MVQYISESVPIYLEFKLTIWRDDLGLIIPRMWASPIGQGKEFQAWNFLKLGGFEISKICPTSDNY